MITFLTRCHPSRPTLREKCMDSLRTQSSKDFEHLLIGNYTVEGSVEANRLFGMYSHIPRGDYVQILDDDCRICNPEWVAFFNALVSGPEGGAPVYFCKLSRPTYPDIPMDWPPKKGSVDGACVIARRDAFMKHISKFSETNTGDWDYIESLLSEYADEATMINATVVEAMMVGEGDPEPEKENIVMDLKRELNAYKEAVPQGDAYVEAMD